MVYCVFPGPAKIVCISPRLLRDEELIAPPDNQLKIHIMSLSNINLCHVIDC